MRNMVLGIVFLSFLTAGGQTEDKAAAKGKAEKFVKEAVVFAKQNGDKALLRETNQATGRFHIKQGSNLYLFIYNMEGICIAHGSKPELVGMNRLNSKDPGGTFYVKEFITTVNTKGKGWVDYTYPDPITGKIQPKTTYVELCQGMVVCAGAY